MLHKQKPKSWRDKQDKLEKYSDVEYLNYLQWEPENSGIVRRLLESSFNFKKFNDDETQQLCTVKRPISQNKWFYKCLVKPFAL